MRRDSPESRPPYQNAVLVMRLSTRGWGSLKGEESDMPVRAAWRLCLPQKKAAERIDNMSVDVTVINSG